MDWNVARRSSPRTSLDVFSVTFHTIIRHCIYVIGYLARNLLVESRNGLIVNTEDRGLRFREHYQSVNALAYLWAWYFSALRWRQQHELKEVEKDALDNTLAEPLDLLMDRWL